VDQDGPAACFDVAAVADEFSAIAARPLCIACGANNIAAEQIFTIRQKAAQAPESLLRIFKRIEPSRQCWPFDSQPRSSEF
jgi:hypothetical protein